MKNICFDIKSNKLISGVIVSVLASSVVDHGFDPRSNQRLIATGICCSTMHTDLRSKSKDRLIWNQDNVSEWSDRTTCGLLFQRTKTIKI